MAESNDTSRLFLDVLEFHATVERSSFSDACKEYLAFEHRLVELRAQASASRGTLQRAERALRGLTPRLAGRAWRQGEENVTCELAAALEPGANTACLSSWGIVLNAALERGGALSTFCADTERALEDALRSSALPPSRVNLRAACGQFAAHRALHAVLKSPELGLLCESEARVLNDAYSEPLARFLRMRFQKGDRDWRGLWLELALWLLSSLAASRPLLLDPDQALSARLEPWLWWDPQDNYAAFARVCLTGQPSVKLEAAHGNALAYSPLAQQLRRENLAARIRLTLLYVDPEETSNQHRRHWFLPGEDHGCGSPACRDETRWHATRTARFWATAYIERLCSNPVRICGHVAGSGARATPECQRIVTHAACPEHPHSEGKLLPGWPEPEKESPPEIDDDRVALVRDFYAASFTLYERDIRGQRPKLRAGAYGKLIALVTLACDSAPVPIPREISDKEAENLYRCTARSESRPSELERARLVEQRLEKQFGECPGRAALDRSFARRKCEVMAALLKFVTDATGKGNHDAS